MVVNQINKTDQTVEENKALMKRMFLVAFNENKSELLSELCTSDFICASPFFSSQDGLEDGKASLKELISKHHTVYPDIKYTIDNIAAEETMIAISFTYSGTHLGEIPDIPATGEKIEVKEICFAHISDGKFSRMQFCPYGDSRSVLSKN